MPESGGTLIKFGKEADLLQLRDEGLLYMNNLRYFWGIEDEELRGDCFDCVAEVARGPKVVMRQPDGKDLVMTGKWVLRIHPPAPEKTNIFSMFALRSAIGNSPIDECNFRFGEHALVMLDPQAFMTRVETHLKAEKIEARGDLVEYVNDDHAGKLGPFKKLRKFSYQSEWRLVCPDGPGGPRMIRIGSIRDISVLVRCTEINTLLRIEYE
ncbi:MAG: hypothetical protein ACYC7J_05880 [Syntrophales bacterium]